MTMTRAPSFRSQSIVGTLARMRVTSATRPFSSRGTLRSARTSTRLPRGSRSLTESFPVEVVAIE